MKLRLLKTARRRWRRFLLRRRKARDIRPEAFRCLTMELRELARVAEGVRPQESDALAKIHRIQKDMEQLEQLTSKREFKRLPPEKRFQLRQSLINSRDQLLASVSSAPSPTSTLQ